MPTREDIIGGERSNLERTLRTRYGATLVRGPVLVQVVERNLVELELMRMHDGTNDRCHKDYVIVRRDYEMQLVFEFEIRTPQGNRVGRLTSQGWFKIVDEQVTRTEWHCPPGIFDLPAVPDNYCMLTAGKRAVWRGGLHASITIHAGGRSPGFRRPTGDLLVSKRYRLKLSKARRGRG